MQRVVAIDFARFIAIVGMMAAHLLTSVAHLPWMENVTSGFPSTLFAVLGGFGVVFASRKYLDQGRVAASVVAVSARGLVVVAIGLVMEGFPDHPIAVILVYYGFAIMVGSALVLIPTGPLLGLAALGSIGGPLLLVAARGWAAPLGSFGMLDYSSVLALATSIFLTGTYPVVTWSVYFAVGIVVSRAILTPRPLRSGRLITMAVGAGGAFAFLLGEAATTLRINAISPALARVNDMSEQEISQALRSNMFGAPYSGGWDAILIASPHSGSTADILRTAGAAVFLICVLALIFSFIPRTPLVLQPLVKVGATPLTVYVLHIALSAYALWIFAFITGPTNWWEALGTSKFMAASFWWQLGIILGLGVYWTITGRRGPLERFVTATSAWAVRVCGLDGPPRLKEQAPPPETPL